MKGNKLKPTLIALIALLMLFGCSNNHQEDTEKQSELKERVHKIMNQPTPKSEAESDNTDSLNVI